MRHNGEIWILNRSYIWRDPFQMVVRGIVSLPLSQHGFPGYERCLFRSPNVDEYYRGQQNFKFNTKLPLLNHKMLLFIIKDSCLLSQK
jgi:hypothetical protein